MCTLSASTASNLSELLPLLGSGLSLSFGILVFHPFDAKFDSFHERRGFNRGMVRYLWNTESLADRGNPEEEGLRHDGGSYGHKIHHNALTGKYVSGDELVVGGEEVHTAGKPMNNGKDTSERILNALNMCLA